MPSAEKFLSLPGPTRSNIVAFAIVIIVSNMIFPTIEQLAASAAHASRVAGYLYPAYILARVLHWMAKWNDDMCVICLEVIGSDGLEKPTCEGGHDAFHATCLRTWFNEKQTCPTCRRPATL